MISDQTIKSGDFSVAIIADNVNKAYKNSYTYISLLHNSEYSLLLKNSSGNRCDAVVSIDGRSVGRFRLKPYGSFNVERPVKINKKFVFLKENSYLAGRAGVNQGNSENCIVSVIFYPELNTINEDEAVEMSFDGDFGSSKEMLWCNKSARGLGISQQANFSNGSSNFAKFNDDISNGATALGDKSYQTFRHADKIKDFDHSKITTIQFRLAVDENKNDWPSIGSPIDNWPSVPAIYKPDLYKKRRYDDYYFSDDYYSGRKTYPAPKPDSNNYWHY